MLFTSQEFLFAFLPLCLILFSLFSGQRIILLTILSLFFYGWFKPAYLALILISIFSNFFIGKKVTGNKLLLFLGVGFNLALLGWFKYANFFADNINYVFDTDIVLSKIILPLAISFFTFQQIAYIVDCYRGQKPEKSMQNYALFVSFFPQLIAGPIVKYEETANQFRKAFKENITYRNIAVGLTIFVIGMFKKLFIADNLAPYANVAFIAAGDGTMLTTAEAWLGTLAFTFQLYFDFSGYSDMAIGLAAMFGIILPINFNSPYKAANIIEFWRRWHITLSRFLRDYLYIPLGGNRKGKSRRYMNLMVTMLLGGLWHGASWNFVMWGGLHGVYLVINHIWRKFVKVKSSTLSTAISCLITFLAVSVTWVFFRAENFADAISIVKSMFLIESAEGLLSNDLIKWKSSLDYFLLAFAVCFIMPNTAYFMRKFHSSLEGEEFINKSLIKLSWKPNLFYSAALAALSFSLIIAVVMLDKIEFLYFNF